MTLIFVVGPGIVTDLANLTVIEGATAVFNCTVTGKPTPSIQWERISSNSTVILKSSSKYLIREDGSTSTLTVLDTNAYDIATYVCNVTSIFGSVSTIGSLTVNGK